MSFVMYGLVGLRPAAPINLMITSNQSLPPADIARLKIVYGVDRPLLDRYLAWAAAALQGDFGYSRLFGQPTIPVLLPRLGNSALIMGLSFLLALALAIPGGIAAARRPHSALDHAINLACFSRLSIAPFWLALGLILVLADG